MISEKKSMGKVEAIERLQRRVDWLTKRIDDARGSPTRLSFDEAERAALRFAVEHLETCPFEPLDAATREMLDRPRRPGFISRQDRGEGVQK